VYTEGDRIRSELSLAQHMGEDGFIDVWLDRIPLPPIRLNDAFDVNEDDEGPDGEVDFDVPER
jgi:hypothetical protein